MLPLNFCDTQQFPCIMEPRRCLELEIELWTQIAFTCRFSLESRFERERANQ